MKDHAKQVAHGERFEFGKNWARFLSVLNDERIVEAENSLKAMLGIDDLDGKTFLDVGSGSGLFSLGARRLGATVYSLDYDPQSVACTQELRRRYFPKDTQWQIEEGSVLDADYMKSLGEYDVVYSWGVLHHTGAMWQALDNVVHNVAKGGMLFIAIYNYQVYMTTFNTYMKRLYVSSPLPGKFLIGGGFITFQAVKGLVKDLVLIRNPINRYRKKKKTRGMSMWHDWIDWVGGYPFEVAIPEDVFEFYKHHGFELQKMKTCGGGHGCNEYVFKKYS